MNRRNFIKTSGLIAGAHCLSQKDLLAGIPFAEKKPNIIFILADDLGIGNIRCYGADKYETPNIDKLAQNGVRFTHAYTLPLCGPSRAAIMTGRYGFRTGAVNQDKVGEIKPSDETFIPKMLKGSGYATASIGKWSQFGLTPADFGFDYYLTFSGSGVYWNTQAKARGYTVNGQKLNLQDKEYMPDLMHTHVCDFINKHRAEPFFIYYSLSLVHGDILPTPDSAPKSKDHFTDNIAYMDKLVGKLVDELRKQQLLENTMIIFFGDNGTAKGESDNATIGGRRLVGQKGSMQEGGALVPMIVHWPGTIPAGKVSSELVDSTDFVPTFAELTGSQVPNTFIDGHSFAPMVRGEQWKSREWIFIEIGNQWYVRDTKWKLNRSGELFDMSQAPFEEPLVAKDSNNPEAIAARKRLQAVLDQLNPAGGILDDGDGSGRHASKAQENATKNAEKKQETKKQKKKRP